MPHQSGCFAKQSGLSHQLGGYSNVHGKRVWKTQNNLNPPQNNPPSELPHERFSKGMIKSRTEASRVVKGGRRASVRGALYESTSIAAVYGTICSLERVGMGRPRTLVREYPETSGKTKQKQTKQQVKPEPDSMRSARSCCLLLMRATCLRLIRADARIHFQAMPSLISAPLRVQQDRLGYQAGRPDQDLEKAMVCPKGPASALLQSSIGAPCFRLAI
jgi:hypothetical protein